MTECQVLAVDDDPDLRAFLEGALEPEPFELETAASVDEALGSLRSRLPDVLLLDVRMPGVNGFEFLELLQEKDIDVPVIFMTSYASMDVAVEAMKEGAFDFVTKPLRVEALLELLESVPTNGSQGGVRAVEPSEESPAGSGHRLVGDSPAMVRVYKTIGKAAPTRCTVLVTGETGTGKELAARVLHENSPVSDGPFCAVNCAAIPEALLESELFGHEKGAFTGADGRRIGKFEQARGGTLFLDEIGEMPLLLQGKILRALEQRVIERVGGEETIPVESRVVAATNRDLVDAVEAGEFRQDLYYRLAIVEISLPPLRKRTSDIRPLTDHFVQVLGPEIGREVERVAASVYRRLESYSWPGNVRELRNVIERSLVLGQGPVLMPGDLPELAGVQEDAPESDSLRSMFRRGLTLEEMERAYLRTALQESEWNLSRAADALDVHRNTVRRKMKRFGIDKPGPA